MSVTICVWSFNDDGKKIKFFDLTNVKTDSVDKDPDEPEQKPNVKVKS